MCFSHTDTHTHTCGIVLIRRIVYASLNRAWQARSLMPEKGGARCRTRHARNPRTSRRLLRQRPRWGMRERESRTTLSLAPMVCCFAAAIPVTRPSGRICQVESSPRRRYDDALTLLLAAWCIYIYELWIQKGVMGSASNPKIEIKCRSQFHPQRPPQARHRQSNLDVYFRIPMLEYYCRAMRFGRFLFILLLSCFFFYYIYFLINQFNFFY